MSKVTVDGRGEIFTSSEKAAALAVLVLGVLVISANPLINRVLASYMLPEPVLKTLQQ